MSAPSKLAQRSDIISEFERVHYWHGISVDPPDLLYRSDLESNPFPVPSPGTRWFALPIKTAEGVFNTPLNPVWHTVAPLIVDLFKSRSIKYSALKTARFTTEHEDGTKTLGPIVIWVASHPGTTTAENARDVSPDILHILEDNGVEGVVVEWYEGSVEKLAGPPLMLVTNEANPTHFVRRTFTAALGMPISKSENQDNDAQGSVSFFFHENKKNGQPSPRVLAVSNKHVLREDTTVDYQFMGNGAPRQFVRLMGLRRFQQALIEIRTLVTRNADEIVRFAGEVARLKAKPRSAKKAQAEDDDEALEASKEQLAKAKKNNIKLQAFYKEVNTQCNDIDRRTIGFVDWAPKISVTVDDRHYTRDIGTVELDPQKFAENFQANVVDLGTKFAPEDLNTMFWPNNANPSGLKFPSDRLLRIRGVVTRELLANPECFDENGNPIFIVGKDGNSTGLTVGRYSGLEAYLYNEFGEDSIEIAIYNYSNMSGNFSAKGDSGSLIFTGDGRMVAILHSGTPEGHVTYATPAWWFIEQLKIQYPHADFDRTSF